MSHGVKKETYIEADDKTTKALTFDILDNLYGKVEDLTGCMNEQVKTCNGRFKGLENKKKKNTAVAAGSGFGGGFIAVAFYYLKHWLSQ